MYNYLVWFYPKDSAIAKKAIVRANSETAAAENAFDENREVGIVYVQILDEHVSFIRETKQIS